jgi:GT2 family glycosyltransferase
MGPSEVEAPRLSVVIPTFNNVEVLKRCLDSWERHAADQPVELLVIEDGCKDGTADYLRQRADTPWGRRFLRWFHEDDVNQLRCNNRGFREARAPLFLVWDDDMFLEVGWLVPELIATFEKYPEIGLLSLIRGLLVFPLKTPIETWDDLHRLDHMINHVGPPGPLNWLTLAEVDIVIRPWVVRRACIEKVGLLDEAFCPIEWDEADLALRIREGGWKVATHNYLRVRAFSHLVSSTIGRTPSEKHKAKILPNGKLFHERWQPTIRRDHPRQHRTWWRVFTAQSVPLTLYCAGWIAARHVKRTATRLRRAAVRGA